MKLMIFCFLTIIATRAYSQDISTLRVFADAPLCFEHECFVHVNFVGFENLPAELFTSTAHYPSCGDAHKDDFGTEHDSTFGTSRTIIAISGSGVVFEKLCNPNNMPHYGAKSLFPQRVMKFPRSGLPSSLLVKIKDRKTGEKAKYRVKVPAIPVYTRDRGTLDCSDGTLSYYSPYQILAKNRQFVEKNLYNYCFNVAPSTYPFFIIDTVNKGNTQCSDLKMKTISPSGKEYVSYGSQPGVAPTHESGKWQLQFYLNEGCDMYDFSVNL